MHDSEAEPSPPRARAGVTVASDLLRGPFGEDKIEHHGFAGMIVGENPMSSYQHGRLPSGPGGALMPDHPTEASRHRIFIVSDDPDFLAEANEALNVLSAYKVTTISTNEFMGGRNSHHAADLVVIDVDRGQQLRNPQLYEARRMMSPSRPMVVVSGDLSVDHLRDVVRLNAADWLKKPITRRELLDTAAKCLTNTDHVGHVSAFVSAVGGSGASIMALNAAYLASQGPRRTEPAAHRCILFELDFAAASCGCFLDIGNDYDFRNVLENPARIDTEFVDIIRKEHPAGFSILSVKAPSVLLHPAGEEIVLRILDVLTFQYEFVILDVPYYDTPWKRAVLEAVSDVLILTEPTIPALRQARELDEQLRGIRTDSGVTVVVNKYRRRLFSREVSQREIARIFDGRPVGFLPEAADLMVEAANRGIIPVELSPRAAYSKAARKLLSRFAS